ncbi:MAG: ABC transporter ATP-binding protein [Chloroflexi bacterium]|nr:ABC transporter ATP-binding protein [Chloroflexota bacterium]
MRYKFFLVATATLFTVAYAAYAQSAVLIGRAAEEILTPSSGTEGALVTIALLVLLVLVTDGVASLFASLSVETLAQRMEVDARHELYISLLGKSQTFHDRQRVGDIMARATDDVKQLNFMVNPGILFMFDLVLGFAVPMVYIALIDLRLLAVPILLVVLYFITASDYSRRLNPVVNRLRTQFGTMNARLEETISGIEVVKASTTESFERQKFRDNARGFRDYFVQQGRIEAGYLPILIYGIAYGLIFLHGIFLYRADEILLGEVIAVIGLFSVMRFPTILSLFALTLIQNGLAGADRILTIIKTETELDENREGISRTIEGDIVFENVDFAYNGTNVLGDINVHIRPGQTVAIIGQTGAGKSTLTRLVNRTYDVSGGRILVDGVDVREWNLATLRSQISSIEQDIFLFSRTIAENIAFGAPGATQEQIEEAARAAQAHDFILSFQEGYQTKIGERGVTLSGGQRQRLALARAFLSNPRVLILDDSTSAIDSATEGEIQRALRRMQEGRTVLMITHRLSQIRWADVIIVLDQGRIVASGAHEDLLRSSPHYRRIFARFDVELPPLEAEEPAA